MDLFLLLIGLALIIVNSVNIYTKRKNNEDKRITAFHIFSILIGILF